MKHIPSLALFFSSVRCWTFYVGRSTFGLLVIALLLATWAASVTADEPPSQEILRDGDRVVLLGGTFIERAQTYNYIETALTELHPNRNVTFRNLGWSGDDATGIARAVFGKPDNGFKRILDDLAVAKPTVILVAYGANEAYGGPEQLASFQAQFDRLLDELRKSQPKARLVIVTPTRHENLGPPLPDPAEYNQSLAAYRGALLDTAEKRKLPVIDLYSLISSDDAAGSRDVDRLTDNGLHLTGYGYWRAALHIAGELGDKPPTWEVDLGAAGKPREVVGTKLTEITRTDHGLRFTALDQTLPFPEPPQYSPEGAAQLVPLRTLRIRDLPVGTYDVLIDGRNATSATSDELAKGIELHTGPEFSQVERLRREIGKKNEWFFHRYRPENETYLFLFRKHEQGNNAVEIPMFDPLIADQDKLIAELRKPVKHVYELKSKSKN